MPQKEKQVTYAHAHPPQVTSEASELDLSQCGVPLKNGLATPATLHIPLPSFDQQSADGEKTRGGRKREERVMKARKTVGDGKSLSIAKNHPKPSQEFSERFGPFIHIDSAKT